MPDKIRVVAIAFFRTTDQKYLLCRRGPEESGAGAWEFPGGKVDPGESEKQALVREIQEELSVVINEEKLIYVSDHFHQYEAKMIHIYLFKYEVLELDYQLIDHDQAEWVSSDDLISFPLAQADVPFVTKLKLVQK